MKIIHPHIIAPSINGEEILKNIEKAGRVCYKSESNISKESHKGFVERLIKSGHHSVLEHEKITVCIVCDRGVSHEIVRHRIAAYSQESTRYCRYSQDKFGREITVIKPFFFTEDQMAYQLWLESCLQAEKNYMALLDIGRSAQEARSILPNSLKTEIVVTYNLREWRHFFSLRAAKAAHPQMQQIAIPLLLYFKNRLSPVFDDIEYNKDFILDCCAIVKH